MVISVDHNGEYSSIDQPDTMKPATATELIN